MPDKNEFLHISILAQGIKRYLVPFDTFLCFFYTLFVRLIEALGGFMLKSLLTFLFASSLFAQEKTAEPFAFADFTWLNGNSRQSTPVLDTKYFTGQFQIDSNYVYSFHRPSDHSLSGSTNSGRTNEIQVQQRQTIGSIGGTEGVNPAVAPHPD
jgi:hypothetical protein